MMDKYTHGIVWIGVGPMLGVKCDNYVKSTMKELRAWMPIKWLIIPIPESRERRIELFKEDDFQFSIDDWDNHGNSNRTSP